MRLSVTLQCKVCTSQNNYVIILNSFVSVKKISDNLDEICLGLAAKPKSADESNNKEDGASSIL